MASISRSIDFNLPIATSRLRNQSIFVTGGADGIGAGLVRAVAAAGAYVSFGDMNTAKGTSLQEELQSSGYHSKFIELDVTDWDSQSKAFKEAASFSPHGSLDLVYLNAGIAAPSILPALAQESDSETGPSDPLKKVFDVNLLGVVRGIALAVHYTKPRPGSPQRDAKPAIVLTGSLASYLASPTSETYGSSKFGVRGLFKSLRFSLPEINMRVNMIAPTYVRTSLMGPIAAMIEAQGIKLIEVENVVDAMLRLACDSSINGRCIGIGPAGCFDFGDDFAGHDGFLSLKTFIESGALGPKLVADLGSIPTRASL